ncbi:caspase domain-containing protein [Armillaria novae-zelandiae]|uniref:Caspase domain-containing protein n=1 Tax=Armillaria novae-zelandiae TaxID=153914 RepID=A0AA39PPK4_9AGAR|nr:caspase domain-containing protein [Armillaria novae-zelandiae]
MISGSRLLRSLISPPRRSLPDPPNSGREVRRKALLIGISYVQEEYHSNPRHQLGKGPEKDVDGIRALLEDEFKFKKEDITVLTDFANAPREKWPTKMNIERAIHSFVDGAKAGDIHFIFYAGHGYQIRNDNSHEDDQQDEHIVPCDALGPDFIEKKMIIDDLLKNILVMPLAAADANLTAVFDCCHSGTVLDLSHYRCNDCTSWKRTGNVFLSVYFQQPVKEWTTACRIYRHIFSKPSVDLTMMVPFTMNMFGSAAPVYLDPYIKDCKGLCLLPKRSGPGCVVCISACRDEELAFSSDKRGGSLTRALIRALKENTKLTLKELNVSIKYDFPSALTGAYVKAFHSAEVKTRSKAVEKKRKQKQKMDTAEGLRKITQCPQISSLWPLDMNQPLML